MSGQESTGRFTNYFLAQKAAERIRWSAEQWTANGPIAACTEGDFAELLGAVGKAILDPGMTNMLYFLACASSGKEKAHMLYRLLRARVWYEQLDEDVLRPYHEKEAAEPPGTRKQDALDELRRLCPDEITDEEPGNVNKIKTISARDLQDKDFQPVQWIVADLLPQGLALLASPPKYGKSWFVLDLCLSVAYGNSFLNHQTVKKGSFYLALEDNDRRLQDRMNKVLQGERAPDGFDFATSSEDIGSGLIAQLEDYLTEHPDCGLIVIDTLQKVRPVKTAPVNAYEADYSDTGKLQEFAGAHGICVVVVHHLRKMRDETDPFNQISGTNGILGAADTAIVMTRQNRNDDTTTLSITGRDIESKQLALKFDKRIYRWQNLGDADLLARKRQREEYENSPIVQTIRKLVAQGGGTWSCTAQELLTDGKILTHRNLAANPRALTTSLKELDPLLYSVDGIKYDRAKNGSGGGKHHFYKYNTGDSQNGVKSESSFTLNM